MTFVVFFVTFALFIFIVSVVIIVIIVIIVIRRFGQGFAGHRVHLDLEQATTVKLHVERVDETTTLFLQLRFHYGSTIAQLQGGSACLLRTHRSPVEQTGALYLQLGVITYHRLCLRTTRQT